MLWFVVIARSSNGRTPGSGPGYLGSSPSLATPIGSATVLPFQVSSHCKPC